MSIQELCLVIITISIIVLVVYIVKTLNNLNRTLDHTYGISESIHEKTKALDEFIEKAKELDGIIKYAKIGYNVVKGMKKKDKVTNSKEENVKE